MKIEKIKSYLGFAIRSGEIIFGYDKLMDSRKIPGLVIVCSTQNDKVACKVHRYCDERNITFIQLKDMVLGDLIGRDNCKVVGIVNRNLAQALENELKNGSL